MDQENLDHVPGMHDPVAKAALLKKSNEEMRKRIQELKSGLNVEKNRSNQHHREKVAELKELRDVAEVCSVFNYKPACFGAGGKRGDFVSNEDLLFYCFCFF